MIIISQNKKRIVENLNLGIRYEREYNLNYIIYNTEIGEDLGEYVTEERAKEILQEIINTYKFNRCEAVRQENAVYEMPKE